MTLEVRVVFVGTEGAVIGMSLTRGFPGWLATFYFWSCAVVSRAFALKYFTKPHVCSYGALLLF